MNIEESLGEWHSRFQQFSADADLIIVSFSFLDAQKPKRLFLPILKAESWNDDVDFYLECGLAEMVTVECPSYLEVKKGVLLEEGFVTVKEMERKIKLMEHNMSVMEHRMESWTNRMSTKRYLATSASTAVSK